MGEYHTGISPQICVGGDAGEVHLSVEQLGDGARLIGADFQSQESARREQRNACGNDFAIKVEAVTTSVQGEARVMDADFGLQGVDCIAGYIGGVGEDGIEAFWFCKGCEEVGLEKGNAVGDAVETGVLAGEAECFARYVCGDYTRFWACFAQGDGDDARSRAYVEDAGVCAVF